MTIKFSIGDTVYQSQAGQEQMWVTCPECLGSGRLCVIVGDDSEVSIPCVCCERGYEGSSGRIQSYRFMARTTPTPWAWQKFGNEYCLTGQYGHRPIILSAGRKGLTSRDAVRDVLVPFDPKHPDAEFIVRAVNCHEELLASLKEMREACAACFRVIAKHKLSEDAEDEFILSGLRKRFGVRTGAAIAKAETHDA